MKTIKKFLVIFSAMSLLIACEAEQVMLFDPAMDGVQFESPADTSRFTFAMLPDPNVESTIFTVPVLLAGRIANHDRRFYVDILEGARHPGTRYEIIQPSILKAGEHIANIEIRVWRTPNLDEENDMITIALRGSSELVSKFALHSTHTPTFGTRFERPIWWSDSNARTTFGRWHSLKLEVLLRVLGSIEDPTLGAGAGAWPFRQRILNDYLEYHDIRYPDTGEPMRFIGDPTIGM